MSKYSKIPLMTKFILRKYSKLSYVHNVGIEPLKPITLGQLLEKTCTNFGRTTAVISCHQNKRMTHYELLDEADRVAAGLRRLGFQKGDRIGLWAPNMVEWYVIFMACARGGYVLVPLNPYYQKRELEYSINKVGLKTIIAPEKFGKQQYFQMINEVCPNLSKFPLGKEKFRGAYSYDDLMNISNDDSIKFIKNHQDLVKLDDPCYIMFTSGTTGLSKAPMISHFSAVNNAYCIGKRNEFEEKQHILCLPNPLFHALASVIGVVSALNFGTTVVLPSDKYDVKKNLEALETHKCTFAYGTPTMYVDLVNLQKKSRKKLHVEKVLTAGAVCSPSLYNNIKDVLGVQKVITLYGLTETTGSTFQSLQDDHGVKCTKRVGYVQDHLEVKVVDPNGNIVPRGTPGELCVRGYSVMSQYYGDETKTNDCKDASGWFHTGDLFAIDEEGYGEIVGRIKDLIIRGGENIYPKEIEDFLGTHPDILEAQVIGLPHERLGEIVCVCLRTKDNKQLNEEDIRQFCTGNISSYKIPTAVKILMQFPKTISGKIQKIKLVEMFANKEI